MSADYIANIPHGLIAAVVRIVDRYTALEPVGGGELVSLVRRAGFDVDNRTVREAILAARRIGELICSRPGRNGGYYMARDMNELMDFGHAEFLAKISDMSETWSIMLRAGKAEFGEAEQMGLWR